LPAHLLRLARQRLEDRLQAEALVTELDLSRREDIVVRNSGSLSHIYFQVAERPMDLSEVALLYPSLVGTLISHEGIGLVVGREADEVVCAGPEGTLWSGPEGLRLDGQDPLAGLNDPEWALEQVTRVARFPHAGDVILLGAWDNGSVISFEDQVATHGGLGGPQVWPFFAYSARDLLKARNIDNAEEIYARLVGAYGWYS
jgi:hypothetical protein